MRRDYRLYELNNDEFERLTAKICVKWLGVGVIPFAPGKDGGRDAKFCGTAERFPSAAAPIKGHCVIQAKHVAAADKSCSDTEFDRILKAEHPKVSRLINEQICQHYIIFTNRKLTGGADEKHIAELVKLGLETAHIIAVERIHQALDDHQDLQTGLPNLLDVTPFRFAPDDLIEVIGVLHDYVGVKDDGFNSARDFESIRIRDEKNRINGLSAEYYSQIVVNNSMPYFEAVEQFLKNPRNREFRDLYHDTADELRACPKKS